MKLTIVLIIFALVQVSAASLAQKVTYQQKQATAEQIFTEIRKQTGYDILVSSGNIGQIRSQSVDFKGAPLEEVLDKVLADQPLTWVIEEKTILIKEKPAGWVDRIRAALGVPVTVTGTVLDEQNKPLPGVTVRIKGSGTGTVTDAKGVFALSVPDDKTVIVFSFIGYESQELAAKYIASGSSIILKAAVNNLHEVVINKGYYTEKQELSTGNVSTVTAKEIEAQPVSNVLQALEGRVPGLQITQLNGQPGGGFTVRIRGQNSLSQGNDPFYVIDGVPYDSSLPGNLLNGSLHNGSPLNFINPYDIESVDVLKDADATTIYGSRAANGAILITTKKGKAGPMRVDAKFNSGFSSPDRGLKMLNTQQYIAMRQEAFKNDGATPDPNYDYDINGVWDMSRYTDWQKVLLQNPAPYLSMQASVSGGTTNTQYLVGVGYYRQATPFPTLLAGDGADEKPSVHFNLNTSSSDQKFKLSFTGSYVSDKNTVQSEDFSTDRLGLPPDAPALFKSDGSLNWAPITPGQAGTWTNPYGTLNERYHALSTSLAGSSTLSYHVLPNLELKSSVGFTNTQSDGIQAFPTTAFDPGYNLTSGYSLFNEMNSHTLIVEPQIDYRLKIGKGTLSALIGGTFQDNTSSAEGIQGSNFASDALLENSQAAGKISSTGNNSSQYKYEAVYARLNYNLDDKYLLNVTARRDGSSRFGPASQFGNFGAVGAGWIFSKEKWIEDKFSFLSFGKLRGSYGTTGNDKVGDYSFLELYNITSYPYNSTNGFYPSGLFNPNLAWEIDKKLEIGIELGFFKDRINLSASFYRNRSGNELVGTPLPDITGFSSVQSNLPALVQNTGQEYELHTVNIKSAHFNWSTYFNLFLNRNKLLAYPGLATSGYQDQWIIGQPTTIIKVAHSLGVNPTTGLYQFEGADGQPTYSPAYPNDFTTLINTTPKFAGDFQNTFSYKGLSLDFSFQFVKQTGINLFGSVYEYPGTFSNIPVAFLDHWQKPGDQAKYEMYSQVYGQAFNANGAAHQSDFSYGDASFIRLRNLSLSWDLPQSWTKTIHFESCKVFMQGQNLLTITGYNGIDPENQSSTLPPMKIFTFGFQIRL